MAKALQLSPPLAAAPCDEGLGRVGFVRYALRARPATPTVGINEPRAAANKR